MAQALGPYTIKMWEQLPADGKRYELLDGRLLVTPSARPPHQVWRRGDDRPTLVRNRLTWRPRRGIPALAINLERLFEDLP